MQKWTHIKDQKNSKSNLLKMYTFKYSYYVANDMKQRGAEVTYRIRNNKDKNTLVRPWPWENFFFFIIYFMRCKQ